MKPRVLFISTYSELTAIVKQLSEELNIPMCIREGGFMNDGHLYAKSKEKEFDVIISQGGTAAAIKDLIKTIPVISIQCTVGDILAALEEAIRLNKPLGLISYRSDQFYELESLTNLLSNIQYKVFLYGNKKEFQEQIEKALSLEGHTLVGMGSCIQRLAKDRGLNYVIIRSNYKTIRQAILSAKNIIDLVNTDKLRAERLKSIIDYSVEGIFSVDKTGAITIFNAVAEKILNISAQTALNKNIHGYNLPKELKLLYGNGDFTTNELAKIDNVHVLLNRIPINKGNEYEETIITFQEVSNIQKLERNARMQLHEKGLIAKNTFDNIIGVSHLIKNTIDKSNRYSQTSATVLIQGETGTGKELFAQGIHNASPRRSGPFVAINCAALPENLLESELFGYEEGAFTGAKKGGKMGLFELADNGTIFLDEIGEIPPSLQSRLLRVLQEKDIMRIGSDRMTHINVRIIAATNKNLYSMMQLGKFREDLYFRLNVLSLTIAPLRQRKEDIPCLIEHFIRLINSKYDTHVKAISASGIKQLQKYFWPGNVRELEIFLEKLIILADVSIITEQLVVPLLQEYTANQTGAKESNIDQLTVDIGPLKDMEMQIIKSMYQHFNGNKILLTKILGISRATLWTRLKENS